MFYMVSGKNLPPIPSVPLAKWKWTENSGYFCRRTGAIRCFLRGFAWNNSAFIIINSEIDQLMLPNRNNKNSGNVSTKKSSDESFRLGKDTARKSFYFGWLVSLDRKCTKSFKKKDKKFWVHLFVKNFSN